MLAFADCGADYKNYEHFFLHSLEPQYWITGEMERGFLLLLAMVRLFTDNFAVFHVLWATAMLSIVFCTIRHYKDVIHVGYAMFAFSALYCIQSMNIMRIFFAAAIVLYATRYLINRQSGKYCVMILLAMMIHISSVVMLLPLVFVWCFPSRRRYFLKFVVFILGFFIIYLLKNLIFGGNILGYSYGLNQDFSFGIANVIYHIPLFVLFLKIKNNKHFDSRVNIIFFTLIMMSFVVGWISYFVNLIGRMYVYFESIYVLFPAYYFNSLPSDNGKEKKRFFTNRGLYVTLFIAVVVLKAFMWTEYFETDMTMPYSWIFN